MRLIDADDFKKFMQALWKAGAPYEGFIEVLDRKTTAYDIDKVIKELESELKKGNIAIDFGEFRLFEIVKQGGVSDDVCEWESASDGEFIQNPHTKRLYSNEPSMQNVYCNTCGKKIKVVE